MNKLLVVGGDGGIGSALFKEAVSRGIEAVRTTRREGQGEATFLDLERPRADLDSFGDVSCACLCAAVSGFSDCERDAIRARRINVDGPLALARVLLDHGCFVIFLSTSAVFDGLRPWPDESGERSPTTEYGRQKALAEERLLDMDDGRGNVAIVRLTKVLTRENAVIGNILDKIHRGEPVEAFADLKVSLISMAYVADALLALSAKRVGGIFHLSGAGEMSYADLARTMALAAGADPGCVKAADASRTTIYFKPEFPGLGMGRSREILGLAPEPIESVLKSLFSGLDWMPMGRENHVG